MRKFKLLFLELQNLALAKLKKGVTCSLHLALPGAVEDHLVVQVPRRFSATKSAAKSDHHTPGDEFRLDDLIQSVSRG